VTVEARIVTVDPSIETVVASIDAAYSPIVAPRLRATSDRPGDPRKGGARAGRRRPGRPRTSAPARRRPEHHQTASEAERRAAPRPPGAGPTPTHARTPANGRVAPPRDPRARGSPRPTPERQRKGWSPAHGARVALNPCRAARAPWAVRSLGDRSPCLPIVRSPDNVFSGSSAAPTPSSPDRPPRHRRHHRDQPPRHRRPHRDRPPRHRRPHGDQPPRHRRPHRDRPPRHRPHGGHHRQPPQGARGWAPGRGSRSEEASGRPPDPSDRRGR
jgi:hypothetical protein